MTLLLLVLLFAVLPLSLLGLLLHFRIKPQISQIAQTGKKPVKSVKSVKSVAKVPILFRPPEARRTYHLKLNHERIHYETHH